MKKLFLLSAASLSGFAHAHDGHGLGGSHWHPTDALGFIAVLVVVDGVGPVYIDNITDLDKYVPG